MSSLASAIADWARLGAGGARWHEGERVGTAIYPEGMHTTIAAGIAENLGDGARVQTTTLDAPEHGLTEEVLDDLDVLVWWGHAAHGEVSDEIVERL